METPPNSKESKQRRTIYFHGGLYWVRDLVGHVIKLYKVETVEVERLGLPEKGASIAQTFSDYVTVYAESKHLVAPGQHQHRAFAEAVRAALIEHFDVGFANLGEAPRAPGVWGRQRKVPMLNVVKENQEDLTIVINTAFYLLEYYAILTAVESIVSQLKREVEKAAIGLSKAVTMGSFAIDFSTKWEWSDNAEIFRMLAEMEKDVRLRKGEVQAVAGHRLIPENMDGKLDNVFNAILKVEEGVKSSGVPVNKEPIVRRLFKSGGQEITIDYQNKGRHWINSKYRILSCPIPDKPALDQFYHREMKEAVDIVQIRRENQIEPNILIYLRLLHFPKVPNSYVFDLTPTHGGEAFEELNVLVNLIRGYSIEESRVKFPNFAKIKKTRWFDSVKPFLKMVNDDVKSSMFVCYIPSYVEGKVKEAAHAKDIAVYYSLLRQTYKMLARLFDHLRPRIVTDPGKGMPRTNNLLDDCLPQAKAIGPNIMAMMESMRLHYLEGLVDEVGKTLTSLIETHNELLGSIVFLDVTAGLEVTPKLLQRPRLYVYNADTSKNDNNNPRNKEHKDERTPVYEWRQGPDGKPVYVQVSHPLSEDPLREITKT